jgi:hypothetical protein
MGLGCVAGAAATYLSDALGGLLYTEDIARQERDVQEKSATQVLAQKILRGLELNPSESDAEKAAPTLHWAFGISCGLLTGLLAKADGVRSSFAVTMGMLAFDEVGLSLLGAAPPSTRYPWQTNLRSFLNHAAYGVSLAMAYEFLRHLSLKNEGSQGLR